MKVICDYCGKSFGQSPRYVKRFKHHFCSRDCYFNYVRTKNKENIISKKKILSS